MTDFKAGDRVQMVAPNRKEKIGDLGTVVEDASTSGDNVRVKWDAGHTRGVFPHMLRMAPVAEPAPVGDAYEKASRRANRILTSRNQPTSEHGQATIALAILALADAIRESRG